MQPLYSSLWCCYSSLVVMAVLSIPDQSDAVWLRVDDLDGLVNFLGVCLPRAALSLGQTVFDVNWSTLHDWAVVGRLQSDAHMESRAL